VPCFKVCAQVASDVQALDTSDIAPARRMQVLESACLQCIVMWHARGVPSDLVGIGQSSKACTNLGGDWRMVLNLAVTGWVDFRCCKEQDAQQAAFVPYHAIQHGWDLHGCGNVCMAKLTWLRKCGSAYEQAFLRRSQNNHSKTISAPKTVAYLDECVDKHSIPVDLYSCLRVHQFNHHD
jgi:hypothetical protein